jgi:hypothetical protein
MQERSWDTIERIALQLKISQEAIRKWRDRGVPRSWRLDLLRADVRREIVEEDFDRPPGPRRKCRASETPAE